MRGLAVFEEEEGVMEMAKDPVYGMNVDEKKTPVSTEHKGKTYYFCSPGCRDTFTKNPERFAGEKAGSRHYPARNRRTVVAPKGPCTV